MAFVHFNFESQYLFNNEAVSIILPNRPYDTDAKDFYGSGKRYKVLWLLHGTFGDHTDWMRHTRIELYACERDLMVVMPSAMNSDYVNWDGFGMGYKMWDFFTEELMPAVYNWFPASDLREDNYIAGLSMGGFGAVALGLGHPEKFSAIASLSGPPVHYADAKNRGGLYVPGVCTAERIKNQVENAGGWDAYLKSPANIWDKIIQQYQSGNLPRLYLTCGTKDFFWEHYRDFKSYALSHGMDGIAFEEVEGYGHEWRFWDIAIEHALAFFDTANHAAV